MGNAIVIGIKKSMVKKGFHQLYRRIDILIQVYGNVNIRVCEQAVNAARSGRPGA